MLIAPYHSPFSARRCGRASLSWKQCKDLFGYRHLQCRADGFPGSATNRDDMLTARARQLYETAWSQGRVLLLDTIMAENHAQVDRVWQQTEGIGRRRMKRGILAYRAAYPDIKFQVQDAAAAPGRDKVFVYWTACGTNLGNIREQPPTGQRVEFAGISLLEFNEAGQIRKSLVFRQAPRDEMTYFMSQEMLKND